ncbi:MAG: retron Ec67 family RNA-directed DNA polymerase/endonuclease [Weeksellaceae bacterium]|nr:retron Ec67 family RNA-directed DNA polymerase/endonuclease [Weeksellaceae bacterium]
MENLKKAKNRKDFAELINVPLHKLTYVLYKVKVENLYTSFQIPKRSGGVRTIHAPHQDLRVIQKKLADLLVKYKNIIQATNNMKLNISHGFEKNKSIITNARIHRNKRFVFNVDLENFFESFHFGRVKGFFEKNEHFMLPSEIAVIIAQICCYNRKLPQGAPTSPVITNLICNILDIRILKLAKKYKLDYSRYADDLSFSTNDKNFLNSKDDFYNELVKEIIKAGFRVNDKKSRLLFKDSRQVVTGLVVNEKINVNRMYYKETRAMVNSLYTTGSFEINSKIANIKQLEGRLSFINHIERYNNNIDKNNHDFRKLSSKEKQYRSFIFYKYFFANETPVVITEGKTDIKYLKAALKKHYKEYPALVLKESDGTFSYKVTFLRRTKRLQYLFGLFRDGAPALKNLYNFFSPISNKDFPNYLDYFKKISNSNPKNPVIMIFDNELANKTKPLANFANHCKLDEGTRSILKEKYQVKLQDNLFLMTNPLVENKAECEIEDLFHDAVLKTIIGGKIFSREKNADPNKYYGKEIFSNYIMRNYSNIDFSNFKPMLENLNEIVGRYK